MPIRLFVLLLLALAATLALAGRFEFLSCQNDL
jgi:hypothetical protein